MLGERVADRQTLDMPALKTPLKPYLGGDEKHVPTATSVRLTCVPGLGHVPEGRCSCSQPKARHRQRLHHAPGQRPCQPGHTAADHHGGQEVDGHHVGLAVGAFLAGGGGQGGVMNVPIHSFACGLLYIDSPFMAEE